jgi:NADPH:quinone reductase-like Zn-dependent oxidoreductase
VSRPVAPAGPGRMKAAVRDVYGPPEVVRVEEVATPSPTGNQVLVRVRAASINRADLDGLYPRWQFTRLFLGLRKPKSRGLGLDLAGVVEAVGPEASRFKPGDRVFGDLSAYRDGAFAEYVCAGEKAFALIPDGMSFEDAATLPHSAILALQGLRLRNGRTIGRGDRVLVDGASGNVGPFVVQMAKAMGAEVTAVASTPKLDLVRALGADHVIDYTTVDYTRAGQHYDWIVAVDAHYSFLAVRRALRRGGVYVAMGGSGVWLLKSLFWAPILGRITGKRLGLLLWWKPFNPDDVARVLGLIAEGRVRPTIDRHFRLDDIAAALRYVDDGKAKGKVIIDIGDGESTPGTDART